MAYKGVLNDIATNINLGLADRMPVLGLTEEFDVALAGIAYGQYSAQTDSMVHCRNAALERFGYDWICLGIDDVIEFEPLGVSVITPANAPRAIQRYLPPERSTLKKLAAPNPQQAGRMPTYLKALSALKEKWSDSVMICGRVAAPFSATTLLYGITNTMYLCYDNPALIYDTMQFFLDAETDFANAQINAGADALWVGDCTASSIFLSIEHYRQYAFEPARVLLQRLKEVKSFNFYFAAETKKEHVLLMSDLGASAIGIGEKCDIIELKKALADKTCLMGNIDPIKILRDGNPDLVKKHVSTLVSSGLNSGGLLVNTGEGITSDSPVQNVQTMIETIRSA